jgi:Peptidase propeptide and YPEB domain
MRTTVWSALALLLSAACASAQQTPKVAEATARATALARVPGGHVTSHELEEEDGRLIYSYDIEVPGRSGVQEVNVDAMTGEVVGEEHEEAAAERAEQAEQSEQEEAQEEQAPHVPTPPAPYAQSLVDAAVVSHAPVKSVEMAVVLDGVCRTIAATAPEDIGERCAADENDPMQTGEADVEEPSQADPIYDITQALHDAGGHLIGAVGMDIEPGTIDRAAVVALAQSVLRELEAQIPSQQRLFERAP